MKQPTTKDGKPLKRIMFEGAEIWVLPHVDEAQVIEKFKNRRSLPDYMTAARINSDGTIQNKGYSSDY